MKVNRRALGLLGEEAAAELLERKGWRILERNWRKPWGELDLVCRDDEDLLVFIEVKAQKVLPGFIPEQHIDERKRYRLQRLAQAYLFTHPKLRGEKFRIDVVAVELSPQGEILQFRHHEGAVRA